MFTRARRDQDLHSPDPGVRLVASRSASRRTAGRLIDRAVPWPPASPGAVNAWLLLVASKPPSWQDPLMPWRDSPPVLGEAHEGFFYPDPLGFWTEVRRWAVQLMSAALRRELHVADALSLCAVVHQGEEPERLVRAVKATRPGVVLFLDEPSWAAAAPALPVGAAEPFVIPDPHRPDQTYTGWWATDGAGSVGGGGPDGPAPVVGKAPQHPASHRLYRADQIDRFLAAAPIG